MAPSKSPFALLALPLLTKSSAVCWPNATPGRVSAHKRANSVREVGRYLADIMLLSLDTDMHEPGGRSDIGPNLTPRRNGDKEKQLLSRSERPANEIRGYSSVAVSRGARPSTPDSIWLVYPISPAYTEFVEFARNGTGLQRLRSARWAGKERNLDEILQNETSVRGDWSGAFQA